MDFEQMKVVWDAQNAEPLYAIREAELHAVVRRKNEEFNRGEARRYRREILGGLVFGGLMVAIATVLVWGGPDLIAAIDWVRVPISRWDVAAMLTAAVLYFYYAAHLWSAQQRQQRREEDIAATLRGEIDRALARTAFLTANARSRLWRGFVPQWVATLLWVTTTYRLMGAEASHYLGALIGMLVSLMLVVRWEARRIVKRFEPRRHELEALRQKLNDAQR